MIRTIIIDDEANAVEVLQLQLNQFCEGVEIVEVCTSSIAGIKAIEMHQPDLVLLDIEMPHLTGFDVIEATKNQSYQIIFTTAYNEFAIKAFKVSAIDYLLKPIDIVELRSAIQKVHARVGAPADVKGMSERLKQLESKIGNTKKIALPTSTGLKFYEANEILRIESDSNYSHVFLLSAPKITLAKTLKSVEEMLGDSPFCRVHQSHIVNIDHIDKVEKGEQPLIVMSDGAKITVSRQRKEEFYRMFKMF